MSGTLKKVRFKKAWQNYKVGDIIQPTGTQRDWLVANGYVELVNTGTIAAPLVRGRGRDAEKRPAR